jgi:16S rRNA (adenine1518-N6/adenine1519-N6)-dimethyltransferase
MSLAGIRASLAEHGLHLSRDLGQNFLVDDELANRLALLAGVGEADCVIEIGTGLGGLTRALAARARRVVSLEVDSGLVRALRSDGALPGNVELLHADALKIDLSALVREERSAGSPVHLVANLPYSAASPLLRKLLDLRGELAGWAVMVQREMARRLVAAPGSKDYSSLTVIHRLTVDLHNAMDLSPRCFFPVPKVYSSFLRVVPRSHCELEQDELAPVERVVRAAFAQRRKTLVNSILGAGLSPAPSRQELEAALSQLDIDPRARAESLTPESLLELARALRGSA